MTTSQSALVPDDWKTLRLKFAASLVTEKTEEESLAKRYVGLEHIESFTGRLLDGRIDGEVGISTAFDQSHVLFGKLRPYLAKVFRPDFAGYCSSEFLVLRPYSLDRGFLFWYCLSDWFLKNVDSSTYGAKMPRAGWDFIGNLRISYPSSPQRQRAIARFLDQRTAAIDVLVQKKERLIELLQERRLALITQAVTRGIDPTAPMKDSGIEWLGRIPAHWVLSRLGFIARVVRGASPRPAGDQRYFHGDHTPWITVGELTEDDRMYLDGTETFLTELGRQASRVVAVGTLLLTNSGATLGIPKITRISGCINDGSVAFLNLAAGVCREYVYYYLLSLTQNYRERLRQGAGQPNLNTELVRSTPFPYPPVAEQQALATAIGAGCQKLDAVLATTRKQIGKLHEYRQALISAAVTGKGDVRVETAA